jgi:type IV pilus assembly protein PilY1
MLNGKLSLVDKNNNAAVLSAAGFFSPTAQSFWTEDSVFFSQLPSGTPASANDNPDGSIVEKGGAAQQLRQVNLQSAASRNVKTLSGGAMVDFTTGSSGLPATTVSWARGENNVVATAPNGAEDFIGSYDNSGTTTLLGATGARHSMHGDVLHSRPVALNYGSGGVIVYYGTNDGYFRAVDGSKTGGTAGRELWSFIPPELYPVLTRQRDGTPTLQLPETNSSGSTLAPPAGTAPKSYGMDGPIGVYARYSTASVVSSAFIYATMRRGGRSIYAFDVSTPSAPTYKWQITGGSTAGFAKLAQSWSMPKAVVTSSTVNQAPILIMGGGYDAAEDLNSSNNIGNSIFIINGDTGELIKELATDFSVPSDVTIVDTTGDGEPNRAYVADVRGNLYRIDFPSSGSLLASASWASTSAVKIADVGGKVFYAPDVVVTKDFVAVLVGTGDREKPLLASTTDKFVLIKDNVLAHRASVLTIADLTRVAKIDNTSMAPTSVVSGANDPEGCYLELATNGEKVVNAPFTIAGATYFGTNRPTPTNANSCSADLGQAYAYKFPLFCSVPTPPSQLAGGGLPPSPVGGIVTIDVNGVPTQMPFLIGGTGPSAFDVSKPEPPIPPVRTRQHWRIDNTNR